jgi:aminoglycoside phosphotransferase family enzyme
LAVAADRGAAENAIDVETLDFSSARQEAQVCNEELKMKELVSEALYKST